MVGGSRSPTKFAGRPFSISSVGRQLLRQRCDAPGFQPLPIEIIARQKVAPAFEPQKLSIGGLTRTAADGQGSETGLPHGEGPAKIGRRGVARSRTPRSASAEDNLFDSLDGPLLKLRSIETRNRKIGATCEKLFRRSQRPT